MQPSHSPQTTGIYPEGKSIIFQIDCILEFVGKVSPLPFHKLERYPLKKTIRPSWLWRIWRVASAHRLDPLPPLPSSAPHLLRRNQVDGAETSTWNPFILCFMGPHCQKQGLSNNQNKGHLGSRKILCDMSILFNFMLHDTSFSNKFQSLLT